MFVSVYTLGITVLNSGTNSLVNFICFWFWGTTSLLGLCFFARASWHDFCFAKLWARLLRVRRDPLSLVGLVLNIFVRSTGRVVLIRLFGSHQHWFWLFHIIRGLVLFVQPSQHGCVVFVTRICRKVIVLLGDKCFLLCYASFLFFFCLLSFFCFFILFETLLLTLQPLALILILLLIFKNE